MAVSAAQTRSPAGTDAARETNCSRTATTVITRVAGTANVAATRIRPAACSGPEMGRDARNRSDPWQASVRLGDVAGPFDRDPSLPQYQHVREIQVVQIFQYVRGEYHGDIRLGVQVRLESVQQSSRATGSSPAVGSSRRSSLASCPRAEHSATFRLLPRERLPTRASTSRSSESASASARAESQSS